MENHPIPQDITGFQFRLIGDMTVKQFAYLIAGFIVAFLFYVLPIPIVNLVLALMSVLVGAAFAFLPIEGRPMDTMIRYFFRSVFSSTQFVYQASNVYQEQPTTAQKPKNKLDEREMVFFDSVATIATQPSAQPNPIAPPSHMYGSVKPVVKEQSNKQEDEEALKKEADLLQKELQKAREEEITQKQGTEGYEKTHEKVTELQKLLNDTLFQKQELEKKILSLQQTLDEQSKTVYSPSVATAPEQTENVRVIPQALGKTIGIPNAPEFPNIVSGIVKDPRGNPLSNILVEVKDNQGNAVRAFKTNALGQFASATPLTNGEYRMEFEDSKGQNKFDAIVFGATGQVILPVEVVSVDTREELRRSLFNN
jgi:hypothetical protein